jgi:hypothetical protein
MLLLNLRYSSLERGALKFCLCRVPHQSRLRGIFRVVMPAHCVPGKFDPFAFFCPSCEAEYRVITVVARSGMHHRTGCLRCEALFPVAEGSVSLKYTLMAPRRGKARSRRLSG